jgi:N-acyl amino acid synthase of PEP-CTERM/exosortase system
VRNQPAVIEPPATTPQSRFRVISAFSREMREEVFHLRHRIFCEELTWFERRPDGREIDEYDDRSSLLLLRHAHTNEPVGCVRLVKTRATASSFPLPFENICGDLLDKTAFDPASVPRHTLGEASRLGVLQTFRKRKGEESAPDPVPNHAFETDVGSGNNRQFPYILISLYLGTIALAVRDGIEHLVSVTEPRLVAHLSDMGVPIRVIGSPVQYKGLRVPGVMSVPRVIDALNPFVRKLYEQIVQDVASQHRLQTASAP